MNHEKNKNTITSSKPAVTKSRTVSDGVQRRSDIGQTPAVRHVASIFYVLGLYGMVQLSIQSPASTHYGFYIIRGIALNLYPEDVSFKKENCSA